MTYSMSRTSRQRNNTFLMPVEMDFRVIASSLHKKKNRNRLATLNWLAIVACSFVGDEGDKAHNTQDGTSKREPLVQSFPCSTSFGGRPLGRS